MEGFLYCRLTENPTTLDPALIVDVQGGSIAAKLFNGLVKLDDKLNIVPDIAERWNVGDEGKEYTFFLRRGVCFTNKREVTAADFKKSFLRILHPKGKSPNTWVLEKILGARTFMTGHSNDVPGIEIVDKYTLRILLEKPFSPFLNLLTTTAAYVVPQEEIDRRGADYSFHPVGTGPFIVRSWTHNNEIVLERNDAYFMDKAKLKGIVYRIIPEELTAIAEFEVGNIDMLAIPPSEISRFAHSQEWQGLLLTSNALNTYYIGFNCERPPFNRRSARQAVAISIDRDKILRTFYEGRGRPALGPVPDLLRRWPHSYHGEYNPILGRRLLDEEGMKDTPIYFYTTTEREVVDMAEIIQFYLKKVGLNIQIKQLEWSAYKQALNNGEADMFWLSWWADYPDPENFLFPLFHSANHGAGGNRTRFTSQEVDRLIELGQQELNENRRNALYMKAERLISDNYPWILFWHRTDFSIRHPHVQGAKLYPIHSMDKGVEVSF